MSILDSSRVTVVVLAVVTLSCGEPNKPGNSSSGRADSAVRRQSASAYRYGPDRHVTVLPAERVVLDASQMARREFVFPLSTMGGPSNKPWRPLRHFGPFVSGSDFAQVQVWVRTDGSLKANWYDNSFHSTHEDPADVPIYRKYYPGNSLPADATPTVASNPRRDQIPGTSPACEGCLNDVLFGLSNIHYSSKYGGSVCLAFRPVEDTEYELRAGQMLWDLPQLTMSVFVVPSIASLNPVQPSQVALRTVKVEFGWQAPAAYDPVTLQTVAPPNAGAVDAAMRAIATRLETHSTTLAMRTSAWRLAHAFVHAQHQEMIGSNEAVDEIDISDDHLLLTTHERQAVLILLARPGRIEGPTSGYVEIDNEYAVAMATKHFYAAGADGGLNIVVGGPSRKFSTSGDGSGGLVTFGTWLIEPNCERIAAVEFTVKVKEKDPVFDDKYSPVTILAAVPECDSLRSAAASQWLGLFQDGGSWDDLKQGGDTEGRVYTNWQFHIQYR